MKENIDKEFERLNNISKEDIFKEYKTKETGLNQIEASERLEKYGPNVIITKNNKNILIRLYESVINPFNIVLIVVAITTFFTDIVFTKTPSYETFILIVLIINISSIISFTQQEKSNNAANKLKKMIINKIDVIRNNKEISINIDEAVIGDIVKLSSGDMIPGDVKFIETKDLFIDQSSLTGESNPVEKFAIKHDDLSTIGFMGSNIISGSAKAIIIKTGNNTYFGELAKNANIVKEKNSFEKGIDSVSMLLIKMMIIMVPIIFIANFITKNNFLESLLFGITISVGLIPEMLPVIISSSLASGAVTMSKKKTIVKQLSSIQTFGEMDVLCTDKTGTLTEDKIVLEKYLNLNGNEDDRVLKHAFLNSYFQTGLKSLIDVAIINKVDKKNYNYLKNDYIKVDELPFDFQRRRMSVILKDSNNKVQMITKGAVEEIISICKYVEVDGKIEKLNEKHKKIVNDLYNQNSNDGLRMIALAQKNDNFIPEKINIKDEYNMILIGLIGFLDPPKPSSKKSLDNLKNNGVRVVILTGDNKGVALNVCNKLNLNTEYCYTGNEIEGMSDKQLKSVVEKCDIFCKLSPLQKKKIIKQLQNNKHTVGYMGDGINDAPSLKQADIGISVDSAVDIAKETASIILLEKNLNVLNDGVVEGRKIFTNIIKYLKMATSGNFGNMFSVMIASIFLPFLPLLPVHILIQNLLCDFAQVGMPFDNVENQYIKKPKKWDPNSLRNFMIIFGTISTILDILCFFILFNLLKYNNIDKAIYFQTGWFVFGTISQTLIIHFVRTDKLPFIKSKASKQLTISTTIIVLITLLIGFTKFSKFLDLIILPISYLLILLILMIIYIILIQIAKKIYIIINNSWI